MINLAYKIIRIMHEHKSVDLAFSQWWKVRYCLILNIFTCLYIVEYIQILLYIYWCINKYDNNFVININGLYKISINIDVWWSIYKEI